MQEKTEEVKPSPAELASARHDAITKNEEFAFNRDFLRKRRDLERKARLRGELPPVPALPPTEKPGFASYVRSLERTSRILEREERPSASPAPVALAAGAGEAEGRLGNNTESRAGFTEVKDEKTGEIQQLRVDSKRGELVAEISADWSVINARAARFAAQSTAGKLLHDEVTPRGGQWRVSGCYRRKIAEDVAILYSAEVKKAHFGGLMVCGSVWTCPPCAAKVSERRKNEVVAATDLHKQQGGGLYLVTLTCPHYRDDDLVSWLGKFSDARERMRRQRAYGVLKDEVGFVGNIRALEVTYGDANGWHPHEHGLWLLTGSLTARKLEKMRADMFKLWRRACVAAGLPPPNRVRGVDIRLMESAAEYVAKFGREPRWGVGSEMAKQHIKNGKAARMTPFDLLRAYHDGSDDGSHKRFGALFVQFSRAFFGKRQIVWTDGLKQLFGIEQKTDEELAVEEAEDARELVRINSDQWHCVLLQKSDVRQVLLERAESGGYDAVVRYVDALMSGFGLLGPYRRCLSPG